jgi:hypothetical protein
MSDIDRNKVKKFGERSAIHLDMADDLLRSGQKVPSVQIGLIELVKILYIRNRSKFARRICIHHTYLFLSKLLFT